MNVVRFDLNVFRGVMRGAREGRDLKKCEREWMIVASGLAKRTLRKCMLVA